MYRRTFLCSLLFTVMSLMPFGLTGTITPVPSEDKGVKIETVRWHGGWGWHHRWGGWGYRHFFYPRYYYYPYYYHYYPYYYYRY